MGDSKATIALSQQRKLHAKSGNRCAECKCVLVDGNNNDTACVGENAHIYGEKPDAARYDASKPTSYVNSYENLIFICRNCHKKIDTEVNKYSVLTLQKLKKEHEQWVEKQLSLNSCEYTISEIDSVVKYLIGQKQVIPTYNYSIIDIKSKTSKNKLDAISNLITMGLTQISLIESYFYSNPDVNFADRLTNIIVDKYKVISYSNDDSEDVFTLLLDFISNGTSDFKYRAAALGVLVYFFEKCEIFKK